jgi:hypothetical protein
VSENEASVVMSFEAGVLIFCDKDEQRRVGLQKMLPWATPAPPYSGDDVPWHGDHLLNRLHAKGAEYARACSSATAASKLLGNDPPLLKGAFPAHDKVQTLRILQPCEVYTDSLDAHTQKVCGDAAKKELRLRGVLHGNVFSRARRPMQSLNAGTLVAVDGGQHKNYEYRHAVRGNLHIDEYRLVDGSGYVVSGVGLRRVELLDSGDADVKPCLGIFVEGGQPAPPQLLTRLRDPRVQEILRTKFMGLWAGVGSSPGRLEHAECVCRKIFDVELKEGKGVALGAVVKGERVLAADQGAAASLIASPDAFHAMLGDVVERSAAALSTSVKDREAKRARREDLPQQKAKEAAQWVAAHYDLLLVEPEGTLKAPGRVKMMREPPSAAEQARLKDDTSRQIGTRDAFYGALVPFLAALHATERVPVAFATVLGQKVTDPEPRGRAKEDIVRSTLDDLVARLRAEILGLGCRSDDDDIDILVAWRCSRAHLANYSSERAVDALRGLAAPMLAESEAALAGGVGSLAMKLVAEGAAGPVRRAAEWAPAFAADGLYLRAAVARNQEAFEMLSPPRTLVVGSDHAHKLAARLAGLDFIEEKHLTRGAAAAEKVIRPDAEDEQEEEVDFG